MDDSERSVSAELDYQLAARYFASAFDLRATARPRSAIIAEGHL
jgi:hypothetical protein